MSSPRTMQDALVVGTRRFDVTSGGSGGGGGTPEPSGPERSDILGDPARFALWVLLGTIAMLFIGFTSAFLVRRASADWEPMPAPTLLWINTAVLAASSVSLEAARRSLRGVRYESVMRWVSITGLLGALFVAGQVVAWKQLGAQGVFLSVNPHSDFFFMLTGVHVVHVAAALIWFAVVFTRVRRRAYAPGSDGLGLFATFWHFLAVLWAYLLFLLFAL
jgi:cytochrome c oxidase subunit 3